MTSRRQIIYTNGGDFEEVNDLVPETLKKIIKACEDGYVDELEKVLSSVQSNKVSDYLNAMTHSNIRGNMKSLYVTPLMIASIYGHDSIVRFLLENYPDRCIIDAQNYTSNYDCDFEMYIEHFNKQTALWLATLYKHLNVVKILISLGKANINHRADYSSNSREWTPLGLACVNRQIEMVTYLIDNGADMYNVFMNNSTSLMVASAYGIYDLIDYLLKLDLNLLNAMNSKGSTALHKAVIGEQSYGLNPKRSPHGFPYKDVDQIFNTVKLLLEQYKVNIVKDNDGFTPLTRAGIDKMKELVEYFIQSFYTIPQIIDEFELIGSYLMVNRSDYEQTEKGFYYLLLAMKMRYKDPKALILKNHVLPPMEVYSHCTECQTIRGLKAIKANPHRLTIESFLIWERQGVTPLFLSSLERQAEKYEDYTKYQNALQLYIHSYDLRVKTQIDLDKCVSNLKKCTNIIHSMIRNNQTEIIKFNLFLKILKSSENEFIRNINPPLISYVTPRYRWSSNKYYHIVEYYADECLDIILNLIEIGIKIFSCGNPKEQKRRQRILRQYVEQLIKLDYRRIIDKKTLLHLSLWEYRKHVGICSSGIFLSIPLIKVLLHCRAPINTTDRYHNTPLHQLAENRYQHLRYRNPYHVIGPKYIDYTDEQITVVEETFKLLINAGAHLDAIGHKGTPRDCATHEKLKDLFRKYPIELKLKCICARMIRKNNLNYTNYIPERLQSFVKLH